MQQVSRKWTVDEVKGFSKWEQARNDDQLGAPVTFNTVDELMDWLHAKQ